MRHIMIDLFTSSLGLSCSNLIFTILPNIKDQSLPTFHFRPQDYILGRFKRGSDYPASRFWNLCASLLIDTTMLQPIPNFAKTLTSHARHSIVVILLLSTRANRST